ncbi:polysaccharide deacetylase family protein [Motiliproteus sediminis]|uniref:polysaccharide deacetylase family protein n=1 Tax=Motiliproteus sediminis TaxID=1468178 RepID=UPI001AEF46FA|nr:polysaccharide deacetylase family protein [Motiliproteus sediminis]
MISPLGFTLGQFLGRNLLTILNYHQVVAEFDPLRPTEPTAAIFEQHLRTIKRYFAVFTLNDAMLHLQAGTLPPRALVITFDDGYANNHDVALPLLQRYNIPATFFLTSAFVDGGAMWNDRLIEALRIGAINDAALRAVDLEPTTILDQPLSQAVERLLQQVKHQPADKRQQTVERLCQTAPVPTLMMGAEQIARIHAAGMEIGGHSHSHPILAALETESCRREITTNKQLLETIIGMPIRSFAYPNGKPEQDYTRDVIDAVKGAGYCQAVSTAWGVNTASTDPFQLRRFTPWRHSRLGFMGLLARNRFFEMPYVT